MSLLITFKAFIESSERFSKNNAKYLETFQQFRGKNSRDKSLRGKLGFACNLVIDNDAMYKNALYKHL